MKDEYKTAERIGKYLKYKGLTAYQVEMKLDIGKGSITKAIKKNSSVGSHILEKFLHHYMDLNPAWLLKGQGEMIKEVKLYDKKEEKIKQVAKPEVKYNEADMNVSKALEIIAEMYRENRELRHQLEAQQEKEENESIESDMVKSA